MDDLTTFELILLSSNTEFAMQDGTFQYTEAQQRLNDKLMAEAEKRTDFKEAMKSHLEMLTIKAN